MNHASPSPSPWILGLTGGIGSGKSAAAARFASHGIEVVDADQAARWVVEPGRPALAQIAGHFGPAVLQADGCLDRAALRSRIFSDADERVWLERLLHPLIRQEIADFLAKARSPYAILVSPLLIESGQYAMCQRVLVIDVPEQVQIERTLQRDGSNLEQINAIMAAQARRDDRRAKADDILDNDRDLAWLNIEVDRLHHFYLSLQGGRP